MAGNNAIYRFTRFYKLLEEKRALDKISITYFYAERFSLLKPITPRENIFEREIILSAIFIIRKSKSFFTHFPINF